MSKLTRDTVALGWLNYSAALGDSVFVSATGKDNQGNLQQPIILSGPNVPINLGEPFYVAVTSRTSLCTMQALINDCNAGCTPEDFNKCECPPSHTIDLHCASTQIDANGTFQMTISPGIIPNSNQACTNSTYYQARLKFTNGDGKVFDTYAWIYACPH